MADPLSQSDRDLISRLFSSPLDLPPEFVSWLEGRMNLLIPRFGQKLPYAAEVTSEQATASSTYTDLSTVGPEVTGLPGGTYFVLFGASATAPSAQASYMTFYANGADVSVSPVETQSTGNTSISRGAVVSLTQASNTLTAKYKISGGASNGTWRYRFIIAIPQES